VFPESITSTKDGALIIGSITQGVVYRAAPGAGTAALWIKPGTNGLLSVFGVLADEPSNTLWVCSTNATSLGVPPPGGGQGQTALKSFDLKTGAAKGSVTLPGSRTFCNDIAIGPDRAAYVSDSWNPHILRLKPGATEFEVWAQDQRFGVQRGAGLDGIAFGSDGNLYVNTYSTGRLFRVERRPDGSAGAVTELQPSHPLDHPDAIRRLGNNTLLMIEGAGRLDRVAIDGDKANVQPLKEGYNVPVSVTQVDDVAWVLEGQLNYLFDPNMKGQKLPAFHAYAVPLAPRGTP
jgi:sugar lactone lactonase YvrE